MRVETGDFDRDGKADIAVLIMHPYLDKTQTLLRVYRGDGAGGFAMEEFALGGDSVPRLIGTTGTDAGPWSLTTSNAIAVVPGDAWVESGTVAPPLPPAPPASPPLALTTAEGTPVRVTPPAVPGVPQLIAVVTPPAHGTVRIDDNGPQTNRGDDAFVYVPAAGYSGPDTRLVGTRSQNPFVSADGRYVAFTSTATNLVPGVTTWGGNTFVRDTWAGTTAWANVRPDGTAVGSSASPVDLSSDGRYVLFSADLGLDGLGLFRRDLLTGAVNQVDVPAAGGRPSDSAMVYASMTPDGRYVAFASYAYNLVPGEDFNADADIYFRDMKAGTTVLVTAGPDGRALGVSDRPVVSPDGRRAYFSTNSAQLMPAGDDPNS